MNRQLLRFLPILALPTLALLFFAVFALTIITTHADGLRGVTGEEELAPQIRGLGHLLSGWLRPYPVTDPLLPVRHAGLYPFGINTFLQNESEPDKVERSLDMIAAGGFRWIRQEFTWEDLEIHRDGWFVDLRNNEIRNAWAKYDHIVELAEARDLDIIVRLSNPPSWSRATGNELGAKAPPDALSEYGDYVEAVVSRYRGRIRYFQVWNEPNCCAEWGKRSISPEQYAQLLEVASSRAKAANPDALLLTAPLAPTIELVEVAGKSGAPPALNDFLFLQRMYDAGAKAHFDILAVQDYGLWSGATDRRMRPRVINYSRPEYMRDIMIRNGDAHKAIWASEIGWNSTPQDSETFIYPHFGVTPEELRGPYLIEALERQQKEWPWMGVTTVWFFKQASDEEAEQAQYYFKLVAPDFTPLPVWESFTEYIRTLEPTLYRGYHQEDHWVLRDALSSDSAWPLQPQERAVLEQVALGVAGDRLRFRVQGEQLMLVVQAEETGVLRIKVGQKEQTLRFDGALPLVLALNSAAEQDPSRGKLGERVGTGPTAADMHKNVLRIPLGELPEEPTEVELTVEEGQIALDGVIVE